MKQDELPPTIRAARALLGWSREELATAANTTERTIARLESGDTVPREATAEPIIEALRMAGVELVSSNGHGAGARWLPQRLTWIIDFDKRRMVSPQAVVGLYYYPDAGRFRPSSIRIRVPVALGNEQKLFNEAVETLDLYYDADSRHEMSPSDDLVAAVVRISKEDGSLPERLDRAHQLVDQFGNNLFAFANGAGRPGHGAGALISERLSKVRHALHNVRPGTNFAEGEIIANAISWIGDLAARNVVENPVDSFFGPR